MRRTIRFMVSSDMAVYSGNIYRAIKLLITYWNQQNTDDDGNVIYVVMTTEDHLKDLRDFFTDPDITGKHGIISSGLVENSVFVGWPKEKALEPTAFTSMASSITIPKRGFLTRILDRILDCARFRFSPKG